MSGATQTFSSVLLNPCVFFYGAYRIGYRYNALGTKDGAGWDSVNGVITRFFDPPSTLGLGIFGWGNVAVPESRVLAPSDMIAVGEIEGFGWLWPRPPGFGYYHGPRAKTAFCDGHVESSNPDRIPQVKDPNGIPQFRFKPDAAHAKRFNNDNQPHPETWPKN